MKRCFASILGFVLFFISSCYRETAIEMEEDELQFSIGIKSELDTKVSMGEDGSGMFDEGDCITLYATLHDNVSSIKKELSLKEGKWLPKIYWQDLGGEEADFTAFYPVVTDQMENEGKWQVALDQNIEGEYERSDLLGAVCHGKRDEKVKLQFAHYMSRLNIKLLNKGVFTEQELSNAVVKIKTFCQIAFRFETAESGNVLGKEECLIARNMGEGVFQAVLCPQPVLENWRTQCWLEIEIGGKKLEYKAPQVMDDGSAFAKLEAGKQLSLNIELKKNTIDWNSQTKWVCGVNNPPVNEWHYVYPLQKILGLKWNADYGWYDCNKLEPNAGGKDSELCWAATVSNMIYWWLDQNKDYIDRYAKYAGPKEYHNSFDCEIFEYFKKHFDNTGNDVAASLSWFFNGRFGTSIKGGAAFFKDVFGVGPVARITRFGERSFTEEIKKAFQDKESIACIIKYPTGYLHAVSIWGVDFDDKGEVSAIYMADSNDRDLDEQYEGWQSAWECFQTRAGLVRKAIQIRSDGVFMEGSVPGYFNFKIEELNLLGLMRDKWEDYFSRSGL